MKLTRRVRVLNVRSLPLTTGLLIGLLTCALLPLSTAAHTPVSATPTSATSFPSPQARSGATADQSVNADAQAGAAATLGNPITASLELRAGKRIGYTFNSAGKQTATRSVTLNASEADSATRRYRNGGHTYYLLSWGPLAGYWVRLATGVALIPATTWTVLVMVYRQTNLDVVDASGQNRHLGATMSAKNEALMVGAVKTMPSLVREWSSAVVAQKMTVVYPAAALSRLTSLGGGAYWLAPGDIGSDLAMYAPQGSYDSIIVIWQPWDANDYVPSYGWGLAYPAGPSSNGSNYATVTVPPSGSSWWITSQAHRGEPFMHEWLHGVIDYHAARTAGVPALHDNATYDYADQGGTFSRWYGDLMKQHVPDQQSNAFMGINYLAWRSGTTTTSL